MVTLGEQTAETLHQFYPFGKFYFPAGNPGNGNGAYH